MSACPIRRATAPADIALARALFVEYAAELRVDLCFQSFDAELSGLPGDYAPPRGTLLLAGVAPDAFGCVALRPLSVEVAEMKRLYVRAAARGSSCGRALAIAVVDAARDIGYRELRLDTLAQMHAARALYASLGFRECAPYYDNPLPGTAYLSLEL